MMSSKSEILKTCFHELFDVPRHSNDYPISI